jgi:hypothetical protein
LSYRCAFATSVEGALTTRLLGGSAQFGVNILVNVHYEKPLAVSPDESSQQAIGVWQAITSRENGLIQVCSLTEGSGHSGLRARIRGRGRFAAMHEPVALLRTDFLANGIEEDLSPEPKCLLSPCNVATSPNRSEVS